MKNRYVLAYHGDTKESYNDELDLVYRNFLLLDRHDKALVVEGDLDQLEAFLSRYNLKSWIVIESENTSPLLWSDSFPKKETTQCSSCNTRFQPLWFDEKRGECYSCSPLDYKYDTAYPNTKSGESPEADLRKSNELDRCSHCGADTNWFSTLFGVAVPTCSKQCTDSMWRAYQQS